MDERVSDLVIFDGAMGTMLLPQSKYRLPCERLNLSHSELVENVHRAYLHAGAQVLRTNSFAANRLSLSRYGLEEETVHINREAVAIAHRASVSVNVKGPVRIAGSIGPVPLSVPEFAMASCTPESVYAEQAEALVGAGVDMLVCETFQTALAVAQVVAAVMPVVRRANRTIPVAVCLTPTVDSAQTADFAASIYDTVVRDSGVGFFGFNCGTGPESIVQSIIALRGRINLPLLALPSAGVPTFTGESAVYPVGIERFCAELSNLVNRSMVAGIGGCCGTTPAYIEALATSVGLRAAN
ncbi:hypothetical protein C3F09_09025 [candidate division GN15 bacterium]|uniref:Hcy-binding domain-containing protein n=1 Tax=candidate division GN15 bacterium TaxID=2072418 RepID=A0A855WY90_9BACT|nr:MAG: hypothetical protein C3F09_09025 [candidate division GN15 bacterium]